MERQLADIIKHGDMVIHTPNEFKNVDRIGVVLKLTEPTPLFPYQIATVMFISGEQKELVTTVLKLMHNSHGQC